MNDSASTCNPPESPRDRDEAPRRIRLRREVFRGDVEKMIAWMADDDVTEHLNEDQNIDRQLRRILRNSSLPLFSAQFNRNGSFYLIILPGHGPIGFLKLISKMDDTAEIVIVIGERTQWGKGYGFEAVLKGVDIALNDLDKERVVAKIRKSNRRSRRLFRRVGFRKADEFPEQVKLVFAMDDMARTACA